MPLEYYVILTEAGHAAVAAGLAGGPKLDLAQLAVGDGGGAHYDPEATAVALVNERWRGPVNRAYVHAQNPSWLVVEAQIPISAGGWEIREAGVFTTGTPGTLLAIAKYPLTVKPAPGSGSEKDLYVRLVLQVVNAGDVVQEIDPSAVLATQAYVDAHAALTAPHAATPAATPDRLLLRDASGRAQVAAPAAAADIARKAEVDAHAALTAPHAAASAATPSRLVLRDASGRAQMAAPAAAADIARKAEVDAHAALTAAHGATVGADPSRLVLRDAAGRAQAAKGAAWDDVVNLDQLRWGSRPTPMAAYQELPGGLCMQWGQTHTQADGIAYVAFARALTSVTAVLGSAEGNFPFTVFELSSQRTTTGTRIQARTADGGNPGAGWAVNWVVFGWYV